jgi:hypothetical protein
MRSRTSSISWGKEGDHRFFLKRLMSGRFVLVLRRPEMGPVP